MGVTVIPRNLKWDMGDAGGRGVGVGCENVGVYNKLCTISDSDTNLEKKSSILILFLNTSTPEKYPS